MNNLESIPSIMSAIASAAAAIAAFQSLKISRDAKALAAKSALAVHHADATRVLNEAIEKLRVCIHEFSEIAHTVSIEWPREIEKLDNRSAGGMNPRPLRHVLSDASGMLVKHGSKEGKMYKHAARSVYAIVRDGVDELNEVEYDEFLDIADGDYNDFETTFGTVTAHKSILISPAFRWAYTQLVRRVNRNEWLKVWTDAWGSKGWIYKFRIEHCKIQPTLTSITTSLKSEKRRLQHSVFPLESNPSLAKKFDSTIDVLEALSEGCSLNAIEWHVENPFKAHATELVLFSLAIVMLAEKSLEDFDGSIDS